LEEEKDHPKHNVAILLFDGVELLDFAGPGEVFERADNGNAFNVYTVGATTEPIMSQGFVKIIPEYSVDTCPVPDVLVIPGGVRFSTLENRDIVDWVIKASSSASVNLSICTGVYLLAKAELLNSKKVTTHHGSIDKLQEFAPQSEVISGIRYIDNGQIITAAGVSAGIDASLYVVSKLLGEKIARETAYYMEYFWDPEVTSNNIAEIVEPKNS